MIPKIKAGRSAEPNRYSRRKMIGQSIAAGLTIASSPAFAEAKDVVVARAIHQEEDYDASPEQIYETLLNAEKFKAFSGGRAAQIDRVPGGTFSLFDGHIVGRNLELLPRRRIVQAWRAAAWPAGRFSIAGFELQSRGSGTKVILDHAGFPTEYAEHLAGGWHENYWVPLRKYLA